MIRPLLAVPMVCVNGCLQLMEGVPTYVAAYINDVIRPPPPPLVLIPPPGTDTEPPLISAGLIRAREYLAAPTSFTSLIVSLSFQACKAYAGHVHIKRVVKHSMQPR